MNNILRMTAISALAAMTVSCGSGSQAQQDKDFRYLVDEFADLKIMRYRIPGWEELSLQQKEYAYHLGEAAKYGRDILWDQHCSYNLPIRKALENILENYGGDRSCDAGEKMRTNGLTFFSETRTLGDDGSLKNVVKFTKISANEVLPDSLFRVSLEELFSDFGADE